jgi:glycosyltransferase involved in cell wall biosynthesis
MNELARKTISVIIPSRNRRGYLRDLLDDLNAQTLRPHEIIVVDQSDVPYDLEGCVHIRDDGRGPCRAKNRGVETATGDILVFLDDDIRIAANLLADLCAPIIRGEYSAVTGAMCDKTGQYPVEAPCLWRFESSSWLQSLTANPGHPGRGLSLGVSTGVCAIEARVLRVVGGFDLFFDPDGAAEDRELGLRLFHHGYPICYNGAARVNHLSARHGGRRSSLVGGSPLEMNLLYVMGKYFGPRVFSSYCRGWLREYPFRRVTLNPRSWMTVVRRYWWARKQIARIRGVLEKNGDAHRTAG